MQGDFTIDVDTDLGESDERDVVIASKMADIITVFKEGKQGMKDFILAATAIAETKGELFLVATMIQQTVAPLQDKFFNS